MVDHCHDVSPDVYPTVGISQLDSIPSSPNLYRPTQILDSQPKARALLIATGQKNNKIRLQFDMFVGNFGTIASHLAPINVEWCRMASSLLLAQWLVEFLIHHRKQKVPFQSNQPVLRNLLPTGELSSSTCLFALRPLSANNPNHEKENEVKKSSVNPIKFEKVAKECKKSQWSITQTSFSTSIQWFFGWPLFTLMNGANGRELSQQKNNTKTLRPVVTSTTWNPVQARRFSPLDGTQQTLKRWK